MTTIKHINNKKYIQFYLYLILSLLSVVISIKIIFAFSPGGDKIIDYVKTSDNIELCLIQESNYPYEPSYMVSFYHKMPGKQWIWNYFDHQDTRWSKGSIELNKEETTALIKRGRKVVATFDLKDYSFFKKVKGGAFLKSSQESMPDEWSPEKLRKH